MKSNNQIIKYSPEYISYLANGDSAAVFITRDVVKSINTKDKWIDVIELQGQKNWDCKWDFKRIVVEIFPRKIKPIYPKNATLEMKKYITWETAQRDIREQRSKGIKGVQYKIIPKLINRNKGKYKEVDTLWDIRLEAWVECEWRDYPCEIRKRKMPLEPDWEYKILSVKKL